MTRFQLNCPSSFSQLKPVFLFFPGNGLLLGTKFSESRFSKLSKNVWFVMSNPNSFHAIISNMLKNMVKLAFFTYCFFYGLKQNAKNTDKY